MEMNEMEIINPDVKEVFIGKKTLRKLSLYPVSVIDQFKITDLFTEVIGIFYANKDGGDQVIIGMFIRIIKDNLPKILELVIDPEEDVPTLLGQITNNQLTEIANIIYAVNYETISKNVGSLLNKMPTPKESLSVRQSPPFAESMDTDLKIFSESLGNKED